MLLATGSHVAHLLLELFERVVKRLFDLGRALGGDDLLSPGVASYFDFVIGVTLVTRGVPGNSHVEKVVVSLVREVEKAPLDLASLFIPNPFHLVPMDLQVLSF